MENPFYKGQRVGVANDMVLVYGYVIERSFDLGRGEWAAKIRLPDQPGLDDFLRDAKEFVGEIDVTYLRGLYVEGGFGMVLDGGVFRGYAGFGVDEKKTAEGIEILVVPYNYSLRK